MSSLATKNVERALDLGRWLVMAGVAYTLVSTAYYFIAGPAQDRPQADVGPAQEARNTSTLKTVNWQEIAKANLFGVLSKAPVAPTTPVIQEVSRETALPLTLLGVFRADDPKESAAIVAEKGKAGKRYTVGGTKIPGNAELVEVHVDHIVLRRAGVLEALHFPKSDTMIAPNPLREERTATPESSAPVSPAQQQVTTRTNRADEEPQAQPDNAEQAVAEFRKQLDADATKALDSLGVEAVADDGEAAGYRLGNLANSPFLRNTGLLPGDLLVSVNGQPVGNASADQLQLDSLLAEGSARMEILRGKRRFFVTASLR